MGCDATNKDSMNEFKCLNFLKLKTNFLTNFNIQVICNMIPSLKTLILKKSWNSYNEDTFVVIVDLLKDTKLPWGIQLSFGNAFPMRCCWG